MMEEGWLLNYVIAELVGPLTKESPLEVFMQVRKFFDEAWQRGSKLLADLREQYPDAYKR
jgi:hypothetical protein